MATKNLGQIVPKITIGNVSTLEAGTPATVTNVGTTLNPILEFGLPKGDQGPSGQEGVFDYNNLENKPFSLQGTIEPQNNKTGTFDTITTLTQFVFTASTGEVDNIDPTITPMYGFEVEPDMRQFRLVGSSTASETFTGTVQITSSTVGLSSGRYAAKKFVLSNAIEVYVLYNEGWLFCNINGTEINYSYNRLTDIVPVVSDNYKELFDYNNVINPPIYVENGVAKVRPEYQSLFDVDYDYNRLANRPLYMNGSTPVLLDEFKPLFGTVKSVNDVVPDDNGNVQLALSEGTVKSVNGELPDSNGNVEISIETDNLVKSVNNVTPSITGNVSLQIVSSVNGVNPNPSGNVDITTPVSNGADTVSDTDSYVDVETVSGVQTFIRRKLLSIYNYVKSKFITTTVSSTITTDARIMAISSNDTGTIQLGAGLALSSSGQIVFDPDSLTSGQISKLKASLNI